MKKQWQLLQEVLIPGVKIGDGSSTYIVETITKESIYLRSNPDSHRGETRNDQGALRILPVSLVEKIIDAIDEELISLQDIYRKHRKENNLPHLFSELKIDHDPYILGYDSTIYKICDFYLKNRNQLNNNHSYKKHNYKSFTLSANYSSYKISEIICMNYIASLLTKSFLLLTGNSGTGKTKLSQLFAQWLNKSGATLLPVGAGWTDSRPILGFYNSLQNIYQTTPALELILDASENSDLPFFLILDEMNLSHVERYFADFLSAMESGEYIPLHTHGSEVKSPSGRKIPEKIKMPPNLFVIGTVNIDETTYMFSPKVLDRANVIEFKVSSDEIAGFLESGESASREIESAEPGTAAAFLSLALRAQGLEQPALESLPAEYMAPVNRALKDVFEILQIRGFEFAYRAASEIIRFTQAAYELAETDEKGEKVFDVNHVIDTQILQKILPKIHGSRKKIEHLLAALAQYCINDSLEEALNQFKKCDVNTGLNLSEDAVIYKNSYKKLAEMIESVRRDQFVSFIQ